MSQISRRLSVTELSERILEMAKTGVYRESVFEALRPVATKQQIRAAIAHAKQFGLHSVAHLRDEELGTYYQLDLVKYQSLLPTLHKTLPLVEEGNLAQRYLDATNRMQTMVLLSKAIALTLGIIGIVGVFTNHSQVSFGGFSGALSAGVLWMLQRSLARSSH